MINLWVKENGTIMGHGQGLDAKQVAFLQSLKVGDRIVVYHNTDRRGDTSPSHTLKAYTDAPKKVGAQPTQPTAAPVGAAARTFLGKK